MILSRAVVAALLPPDQQEESRDAAPLGACSSWVLALLGKAALQECVMTPMENQSASSIHSCCSSVTRFVSVLFLGQIG